VTQRQATPRALAKRLFDLFLSSLVLLLLSPLLLIVAILIKLSDGGPVLYRGVRVGLRGRPFRILKFRTMVLNADKIGGASTAESDPRVTRVGRFLRRWKLDEFPQFINVLLGDMSVVGPRPQVQAEFARYTTEEKAVIEVQPGITDYASIRFRDEGEILKDRKDPDGAYRRLIQPEKLQLALYYVRHHTLRMDIALVLQTAGAMFGVQLGSPIDGGYTTITEQWGMVATPHQKSMAYTRYRFAARQAQGKRLLEVGCGTGMGLGYLREKCAMAVGGDYELGNLREAQRHLPDDYPLVRFDAHRLPFRDGSFDAVVLFEAIYYLRHPESFVAECRRLMHPAGKIVVCLPNKNRPGFNPSPFSAKYHSASELRSLMEGGGFTAEIFGGFPLTEPGPLTGVAVALRKYVVGSGLVPKTMAGKAIVKRLIYGGRHRLDAVRDEGSHEEPLIPVANEAEARRFTNLYVVATQTTA